MSRTESLMPDRSHQGTGIKGQLFSCISTPYVHFMVSYTPIIWAFKILFDDHLNNLYMRWALRKKLSLG